MVKRKWYSGGEKMNLEAHRNRISYNCATQSVVQDVALWSLSGNTLDMQNSGSIPYWGLRFYAVTISPQESWVHFYVWEP
jgi:hypothetical protein